MTVALFGCEEANNTVDSAQETATEAMDSAQETASDAMDTMQEAASDTADAVQETASDAADAVQETATDMSEAAQDQMDAMQEEAASAEFDFDQFAATSAEARSFSEAVEDAMNVDFTDPQAVESVTERVSNTYQCYVEATSESDAESAVSSMMDSLESDEVKSLIETAIENAQAGMGCMM